MQQIYIRNLRLRAQHGVLTQEKVVGGDYVVNVTADYPIAKACVSDDVADTMNYAEALEVVKRVMRIPRKTLECVAYNIARELLTTFTELQSVTIDVCKQCPPMGADCDGAGVRLSLTALELKADDAELQ